MLVGLHTWQFTRKNWNAKFSLSGCFALLEDSRGEIGIFTKLQLKFSNINLTYEMVNFSQYH